MKNNIRETLDSSSNLTRKENMSDSSHCGAEQQWHFDASGMLSLTIRFDDSIIYPFDILIL